MQFVDDAERLTIGRRLSFTIMVFPDFINVIFKFIHLQKSLFSKNNAHILTAKTPFIQNHINKIESSHEFMGNNVHSFWSYPWGSGSSDPSWGIDTVITGNFLTLRILFMYLCCSKLFH